MDEYRVTDFNDKDLITARAVLDAYLHDHKALEILNKTLHEVIFEKPGTKELTREEHQGCTIQQNKRNIRWLIEDISARLGELELKLIDDNPPSVA